MKKIALIVLTSILLCNLVGCSENVDIENEKITNVSGEVIGEEVIIDVEKNGKYENISQDYVFEDSDKIIVYDLYKYSKDELEIGKNEIFARYGYDFDSESLEEYFNSKPWYEKKEGKKIAFAELNACEQTNVKYIDEYIKLLKEVENCKDINTVEVPDLVVDETLIDAEILTDTDEDVLGERLLDYVPGKKYVKISDDYVLDEKWDENLGNKYYKNSREILPKKLYLMKENANANCYYKYNGEIYYIPVEICETPEEERLEYRDYGLVVYRNSNIAKIWDLEAELRDCYYDGTVLEDLYISDLKYKNYVDGVYEIDLDGDINTIEIAIPSFDSDPGGAYAKITTCLIAMKNGDKTSIVSGPEGFLCGNIGNYRNVFYSAGFLRGLPLNEFIEECYLVKYYIYDKEEGFITVNRFANGDKWGEDREKMNSYELTLNQDITFYKQESEFELEYMWHTGATGDAVESKILPKGTKVRLVSILDWTTNSIVETEDGTEYIIASYAGMT